MNELLDNIKELRTKTELSISEIKNALIETNNDIDLAYRLLLKRTCEIKQQAESARNDKISALVEDLSKPLNKGDLYHLEQYIEDIEYNFRSQLVAIDRKIDDMEYLIKEILRLAQNHYSA